MTSIGMRSEPSSLGDNRSTPFLLRLPTETLDQIISLLITTSLIHYDPYRPTDMDDELAGINIDIVSDLPDQVPRGPGDIASLCRSCKHLQPIATNLLYKEVDLRSKSDRKAKRFCQTIVHNSDLASSQVKGLAFDDFHTSLLLKALHCLPGLTTLTVTIPDPGPISPSWTSGNFNGVSRLFFPNLRNLSLENGSLGLWIYFIIRHATLIRNMSIGKSEQGYFSQHGGRTTPQKKLVDGSGGGEGNGNEEDSESGEESSEPSDTSEASLLDEEDNEDSEDGEAEEDSESGEESSEPSNTSEASLSDEEENEDSEDGEAEEGSKSGEESSEQSDTDDETEKKHKVAPKPLGKFSKLERFHGPCAVMNLFLPGSAVHTLSNAFGTQDNFAPEDLMTEITGVSSIRNTIHTLDFGTFNPGFFDYLSTHAPGITDVKCFFMPNFDNINFVLRMSHTIANFKNLRRLQLRLMTNSLLHPSPSDDDPHHFVYEYKTLQSWKERCPTLEVCSLPNRHRVLWKIVDDLWVPDWTDRNTRHRVLSLSTVQVNQHDFPWMKPFVTGLNQYYFFGEYDPHLQSNPFNIKPNADDKSSASDESGANDKSSGAAKIWRTMFDAFGEPL